MPISHSLKAIFVHVPKTAGTSLEKALGICGVDNRGSNEACYPLMFGNDGERFLQHLYASEIRSLVGPTMFDAYYKFAIVRNPFARVLSAYNGHYHKIEPTFERFTRSILPKHTRSPLKRDAARHLKPQVNFLFDTNGAQLVDFIGRQESLDIDQQSLGEKLGIELTLQRPEKLRSGDYREFYTAASRQIVEDHYSDDLERFGYVF